MNNIFRTSHGNERPPATALLKRAGFFAAGLVLLWLAVELMPSPGTAAPIVHETEDGGVAFRSERAAAPVKPGMIFAGLILVGGVVLAVVLKRKSTQGGGTAGPLETLADMPITADQRLRLIRCGDDVLLLGITSGGVNVLEKYGTDAFDMPSGAPALTPAFADLLRDAAGRYRDTQKN